MVLLQCMLMSYSKCRTWNVCRTMQAVNWSDDRNQSWAICFYHFVCLSSLSHSFLCIYFGNLKFSSLRQRINTNKRQDKCFPEWISLKRKCWVFSFHNNRWKGFKGKFDLWVWIVFHNSDSPVLTTACDLSGVENRSLSLKVAKVNTSWKYSVFFKKNFFVYLEIISDLKSPKTEGCHAPLKVPSTAVCGNKKAPEGDVEEIVSVKMAF